MADTKKIIILVGPPGSGKGTQAEMLADKFGLFNFETSKIIEEKFKNADPSDEVIATEKENWKLGKLVTPELVFEWIIDRVKELASEGKGIVFSGSPRTLFEVENELPIFEELYGRENIRAVNIKLTEGESVKRNSKRRICEKNRHPIPNFSEFENITKCPKDDSPVITRLLDNAETIKIRYQTYLKETEPVPAFLREKGYNVLEINGEQSIEKVFEDILKQLDYGQ
ncbi:MAG: hypothetical protein A2746_00375 [Candidatus Yanofskybacteria bacterium RIFCSPHIGHO2_01_FULL_44_22]|uniref:Adenylate kinase n=1 Tax=Candidatus Yanofskybacteria bacterium RIFCSPHIGHO2_01_FULL_44_22 TaxID=1802669 RepID=A0A1F8ESZ9_9BACT|nr:MAG: hypothetical protein A2746_00375 [Candidatus Yanofskybacteria bacterium RIFCSPHIGHO2_01_FULL_44_22]